jgi:aminopeptidase-like protein
MFENNDKYYLGLAKRIYKIMEDLYPINRSLTGHGVRQTLKYLSRFIPIETYEIPTGTKCFDWTIPNEWNLRYAELVDPTGKVIVSNRDTNLSVVGYSRPINKVVDFYELLPHLHSDPKRPNVIPYRTTYYKNDWGFCIPHNVKLSMVPGKYSVLIDAKFEPGHLTYADTVVRGRKSDEVLLSTYTCHPSMANDNLSGIALQTVLLRELYKHNDLNLTYRGVFVPETLGAIAYLKYNGDILKERTRAGLVVTCVADSGKKPTYKKSRRGNSLIDRIMSTYSDINTIEFCPFGSDERQYCSPGFDLPVGSLMRTRYYESPGYHSSADNMSIVSVPGIAQMIKLYMQTINLLEVSGTWRRVDGGFCEPQLGKRDLYSNVGGDPDNHVLLKKMLWILNLSDGEHDLIDISKKSGYPAIELVREVLKLESNGLIERV